MNFNITALTFNISKYSEAVCWKIHILCGGNISAKEYLGGIIIGLIMNPESGAPDTGPHIYYYIYT